MAYGLLLMLIEEPVHTLRVIPTHKEQFEMFYGLCSLCIFLNFGFVAKKIRKKDFIKGGQGVKRFAQMLN